MHIWAIADLHLSFGVPHKSMDLFGPAWENHAQRLHEAWDSLVHPNDLVLIPGDISWAMKLADAMPDLEWVHERPGTKVMIRGNHDLWWDSISKVRKALPPSIHAIQNDIFQWHNVHVGGARLWDTKEYSFDDWIDFRPLPSQLKAKPVDENKQHHDEEIFRREILRLEESLKKLPQGGNAIRLAMTHYPPIGPSCLPSEASKLFVQYNVSKVVFGHLHSLSRERVPNPPFGTAEGVEYILTSCDWLECTPKLILSL